MKLAHLFAPALVLIFAVSLPAATPPGKTQQLTSPDQVPEGLAKSDWTSIRAAYEAGRHAFQPIEGGWQARNPGHQWATKFDGRGFVTQPRDGSWTWGLELKGYGFPGAERAVGGVPAVKAEGPRLTYGWDAAVQEWWVNDARGLEHGFTVQARPTGAAEAPLQFDLAVRGTLAAQVAADGLGVDFRDGAGATMLTYSGLKVWDADGKILASRFVPVAAGVRLLVEERGAHYPLTIDPIAQPTYLKASNTGDLDSFGQSVAISGDTVVVGAVFEDSSTTGVNSTPNLLAPGSGAAYVFVRSGATWTQQAYLKASNTGGGDAFGQSVSISGNTIVVGARHEDSSTTGVNSTPDELAADSGAAYVFVRSGTTWTQQAYLKPAAVGTTQAGDQFGFSVGVSGDTVVVGANFEGSSTTGVNSTPNESGSFAGAAYVFTRSGTTWTQQAYLKPAAVGTTQASDTFGNSVAISGDTVVVGAQSEDSSTTGVNSTPNESASFAGAAYIFTRSGTTWTQQAYLKPAVVGTSQVTDFFGGSVAISGDTVVVGANSEDSSTTGVNSTPDEGGGSSGAAYVFTRSGTTWTQQAYLKPAAVGTTQAGDNFGFSVAVSGDTLVVGAWQEDSRTTGVNSTPDELAADSGAAYVFTRSGTTWTQQDYLKPGAVGTTQAGDNFGSSVAVSGGTVVVGATDESSSTTGVNSTPNELAGEAGAAWIFRPEIAVVSPAATDLVDGASSITLGAVTVGQPNPPKTFTIRNDGSLHLTLGTIAKDGANAGDFTVNITGMSTTLASGDSTTFTVAFTLGALSTRNAALHISNDDADESPFDIALVGKVLNFSTDTDGDGMSDASELNMAALGFDWEVGQPALVNTYTSNANGAGYYTTAQVQALNVGVPLLTKDVATGKFKLTIGVTKSTNLATVPFTAFPMNSAGFTTVINAAGKLEFQFTVPDNAAFFRVESQ